MASSVAENGDQVDLVEELPSEEDIAKTQEVVVMEDSHPVAENGEQIDAVEESSPEEDIPKTEEVVVVVEDSQPVVENDDQVDLVQESSTEQDIAKTEEEEKEAVVVEDSQPAAESSDQVDTVEESPPEQDIVKTEEEAVVEDSQPVAENGDQVEVVEESSPEQDITKPEEPVVVEDSREESKTTPLVGGGSVGEGEEAKVVAELPPKRKTISRQASAADDSRERNAPGRGPSFLFRLKASLGQSGNAKTTPSASESAGEEAKVMEQSSRERNYAPRDTTTTAVDDSRQRIPPGRGTSFLVRLTASLYAEDPTDECLAPYCKDKHIGEIKAIAPTQADLIEASLKGNNKGSPSPFMAVRKSLQPSPPKTESPKGFSSSTIQPVEMIHSRWDPSKTTEGNDQPNQSSSANGDESASRAATGGSGCSEAGVPPPPPAAGASQATFLWAAMEAQKKANMGTSYVPSPLPPAPKEFGALDVNSNELDSQTGNNSLAGRAISKWRSKIA